MTGTLTDTDLSAQVGEREAPACEHPQHDERPVHVDGDEHYVRFRSDCGHINSNIIKVVCGSWLDWLRRNDRTECSKCGGTWPFSESVTDLGPVTAFF